METGHEDVTLRNLLGEFLQGRDSSASDISTHWLLNRWREEDKDIRCGGTQSKIESTRADAIDP